MPAKRRADQLLVDQGLAESRTKAQALILAGLVYAGERRIDKSGELILDDIEIEVRGRDHPWVSRGGLKLAHALDHFAIDPSSLVALDIGASTGGFTDVLLARGAIRVHAVDVGRAQLAWKLRQDSRVIVHEGVNARYLTRDAIAEPIDLITCDASFIGLATLLPAPLELAGGRAGLGGLGKPQIAAGAGGVGKAAIRGGSRPGRQGRGRARPGDPPRRVRADRRLDRCAVRLGRNRAHRKPGDRPGRKPRVSALRPPRRVTHPCHCEEPSGDAAIPIVQDSRGTRLLRRARDDRVGLRRGVTGRGLLFLVEVELDLGAMRVVEEHLPQPGARAALGQAA